MLDAAVKALSQLTSPPFRAVLLKSAGLAIIEEIKALHAVLQPAETLFVVDAMQGQDAVNVAKAFADALPLTGIVLTKLDGDARGGAALSVRQITGNWGQFEPVMTQPAGKPATPPLRHGASVGFAGWSPDGKSLALTLSKDGNAEIYLMSAETRELRRLTNSWAIDCSPAWSPPSSSPPR